jgi:UDP-N-acetylmuramate dehydrogenase
MALGIKVSLTARDAGLAGLEFMSGVPGTIGGALRMNAGAYGRETKDVLIEAEALDAHGTLKRISVAEMGFSYRHSGVPEDWIFVAARLQGRRDDPAAIAKRMAEIGEVREESQPVRTRTGGSTFKNPSGARAWELIDRAGCRGLTRGKAKVSEKHTNFLINTGGATAADLEGLGEEVRRRVLEASGVKLEWEIRIIGSPLPARPEVVG